MGIARYFKVVQTIKTLQGLDHIYVLCSRFFLNYSLQKTYNNGRIRKITNRKQNSI